MASAFVNARVTTLDPDMPRAAGLLVGEGAIVRLLTERPTGLSHEVTVIDCEGAAIVPGLHDCHAHLTDAGLVQGDHDLSDCASIEALLQRLRVFEEPMIFASNYEEHRLAQKRAPLIQEIDTAVALRPVLLSRIDGHSCVVNSAALALLHLGACQGVEKDQHDKPTGRLFGAANYAAQHEFQRLLPAQARAAANRRAAQAALQQGITTLHNVVVGDAALEELQAIGRNDAELPLNVITKSCTTNVAKAKQLGSRIFGGDIFMDGSIGSRTAAVGGGYCDAPGKGLLYIDRAQLSELCEEATEAGLSFGVHAIGDTAIEEAIAAWESVAARRGSLQGMRPSIDHFEIAHPQQIARAARLGLFLSMQPAFDHLWGGDDGMYADRFGATRARGMNLLKTALRSGCTLCCGSDAPVTRLSALLGIHSAVNHHVAEERLTVEEALRSYTLDAAKLSFDEGRRGRLAAGMAADFAVLEKPLEADPCAIADLKVRMTVIGGEVRYRAA